MLMTRSNPWTGLNERGFPEDDYQDVAAYGATRERLEAIFEGSDAEITELRYWRDAGNPNFRIVRLDIAVSGGEPVRHFIHVPDEGRRAWGEDVLRTLVAWVESYVNDL